MKNKLLLAIILIGVAMLLPHKNEIKMDNSKYSIYLKNESDEYSKSNLNVFPTTGYTLDTRKSSCENDSTLSQNYSDLSINISFDKADKCNLYFDTLSKPVTGSFAEYIVNKEEADASLVNDLTVEKNTRYIGANPDNYVSFNGELWRIIGVMNNIDDGTGKKETRVKLIRNSSIGNFAWDYKEEAKDNVNWSTSKLKDLLNSGAYYNREAGTYYNSDTESSVDFSTTGLTNEAKSLISNTVWNLGIISRSDKGANAYYEKERTNFVNQIAPNSWTGVVGLLYPSDYVYASNGSSAASREDCLSVIPNSDIYVDILKCSDTDYLKGTRLWTITPILNNANVYYVPSSIYRYVSAGWTSKSLGEVRPVVYLNAGVNLASGTGTETNPYTLSS